MLKSMYNTLGSSVAKIDFFTTGGGLKRKPFLSSISQTILPCLSIKESNNKLSSTRISVLISVSKSFIEEKILKLFG